MNRQRAEQVFKELLNSYDCDNHGDYFYDHSDEICDAAILAHADLCFRTRLLNSPSIDAVYAVKDKDGNYYCGYNAWDPQIRKAKFYHWLSKAEEMRDDRRFVERKASIVKAQIVELEATDEKV